jgi:hypothetical protein
MEEFVCEGFCRWTGRDDNGDVVEGQGPFQVKFCALAHDSGFIEDGLIMAVEHGHIKVNNVPDGTTEVRATSFVLWTVKCRNGTVLSVK